MIRPTRAAAATLLTALALTGCADDRTTADPVASPVPEIGAQLIHPVDDGEVHQCEVFRGTARLPEDKTLVLGVRNVDNGSPERYFEVVDDWEYPGDLAEWSGSQWFGSGDSSVGQRFRAEVLIMDLAEVRTAVRAAAEKGWHAPDNPAGATVAAHITLKRVPGRGPSECA
ncbi:MULTISPECIES: hypothetical protein [Catenuloplanes]|uniref:Serine/threonine-protein kinase n=1 Tax=Catenuloplanes niger TaxID=587534 RepID=A0AAE4CYA6_9ACTN|nr:hypothetical protein [Catenuloplanes niger]MDR7327373.1 serine/threonine-protein kinase [Catenuloplanes niger]